MQLTTSKNSPRFYLAIFSSYKLQYADSVAHCMPLVVKSIAKTATQLSTIYTGPNHVPACMKTEKMSSDTISS